MISGSFVCTSFKTQVLEKQMDLSSDTIKMALYTNAATLNASTTAYSITNESAGAGYVAGGVVLAGVSIASGTAADGTNTVYVSWTNPAFGVVTLTTRGALIYNSTAANKAIAVIDFGADLTYTARALTVQLPSNDPNNAILRF